MVPHRRTQLVTIVKLLFVTCCLSIFGCTALATTDAPVIPGNLVIVGGALSSDTESIYRAFIDGRPARRPAIAIIPAASGKPSDSAAAFKRDLVRYGVDEELIQVLPIAIRDDSTTPELDESQWKDNGHDELLADAIERFGAFWFVGGDQIRITDTLLPAEDRPSVVLTAIREQHRRGAVIGGTSAGAAVMSSPMIGAGDSFAALTVEPANHYAGVETQERGQLYLHHGLGFFPFGITDQHFDRRARLGRLVRALAESGIQHGYAVDEDTAMLVDFASREITAIGSGNVTIVNATSASFQDEPFGARNVSLSILSAGDRFSVEQGAVVHTSGEPTNGNEYFSSEAYHGAGIALGNSRLDALLGSELADNSHNEVIRRYNFLESGSGFMYRFGKTAHTRGFWSNAGGSEDRYTVENIRLDIVPVRISIDAEF